jgi:putative addiction module killer protein
MSGARRGGPLRDDAAVARHECLQGGEGALKCGGQEILDLPFTVIMQPTWRAIKRNWPYLFCSLLATMAFVEVKQYQTAAGKVPLIEWLDELRDPVTRARIVARLDRLKAGLLGDWKFIGDGVFELRVDVGPGFRVYYGQAGKTLILLLCGGDKRTQTKDIENAHAYWKDYQARKPKPPVQRGKTAAKRGRGRRLH